MKTSHSLNMRLIVVLCLTTITAVTTAIPSFAQLAGGVSKINEEYEGGNPLVLQGTYSEARNAGNLITVWRGASNNQVWISVNNGKAFTIGGTVTYVDPTVVAWGDDGFMVFHTGDTGTIFYTPVYGDGNNSGIWTSVPGNFTNLPVSVAQMGTGSSNLYLVYRGLGNDLRVWGTWYDFSSNTWANAAQINGGMANTAPGVSMNYYTNQLFVTAQGTDNQLWITHQGLGAPSWNNWSPMGVYTSGSPYSVGCANGNMVFSILNSNGHPEFAEFDGYGDQHSGWYVDTIANTASPARLTANGNTLYATMGLLVDNLPDQAYWQQVYNCQ